MSPLNPNDFRRKNLVKYDGRIFEIDTIAKEFPTLNTDEFGVGVVDWKNVDPIPLSEDVLPKLGFKEIGQAWTNGFIELSYIVSDDYFQCEIRFPFSEWVIIPVKWVHKLQNIIHSLTGEEIMYTEK